MSAETSGDLLVCRDWSSGEIIAELRVCGRAAVGAAVGRARAAQGAWAALGARERARWLHALGDSLIEGAQEAAAIIARETGKPHIEALSGDVFPVLETIRYYARHAPRLLRTQRLHSRTFPHRTGRIHRIPRGVVGVIAPWNYPLSIPMWSIVPALAAGNTVVVKPSEKTPLTGLLIAELARRAGLPDGALQVVTGDGRSGEALVEAGIDHVSFTGSVVTGRRIARRAGELLVPVTLELGGKDPALVLDDADLEQAAAGIVWGAFANSGQVCASVERVYVVSSVAEELTRRIVAATKRLRLAGAASSEVDITGLIDTAQLATVVSHLDDAVARGARVLTGGRPRPELPGLAFEPTVFTEVAPHARVLHEETFGPLLPIVSVDDVDDAIARANDSPFGLTASIWTRSRRRAREVAQRLKAGVVLHNDAIAAATAIEAPWGGTGISGLGRTRGERGLLEFVEEKHVSEERLHLRRAPFWFPYRERTSRLMLGLLPVVFHSRWSARLAALARMPRVLTRRSDRRI